MDTNNRLKHVNRSYIFEIVKSNVLAIALVILFISLGISRVYFIDNREVTNQRIVTGYLNSVIPKETQIGSKPKWLVKLDKKGTEIMVSPSKTFPFNKGKKVDLVEYEYQNGSVSYAILESP